MFRTDRTRLTLRRALILFAVLGVTTGWTTPTPATAVRDHASVVPAGVATASAATGVNVQRVATAASRHAAIQDATWNAIWDARSARTANDSLTTHRHERWVPERPKPAPPPAPEKKERVKAPAQPAPAKVKPAPQKQVYQGTNHFWIPSLGMSYGVHWYACGRTTTPGNHIYRWGCAGSNNVYLLGHAYSVMKPLHDLYVRGGLRVGMKAVYADANGRVRTYRVTEWRVVRPTQVAWQIASQPRPSMTLQTCIGKNSEYRLNVRLVAVN